MVRYSRPSLKSFDAAKIQEVLGAAQTQYDATMNVYGGRTAYLNDSPAEYRIAQANVKGTLVTYKEVANA